MASEVLLTFFVDGDGDGDGECGGMGVMELKRRDAWRRRSL